MNWEDERYVRVYVRDTVTWKVLPWQGKCLLPILLRKADRSGCVDIGGAGADGVAALVDIPLEVAAPGLAALLLRGVVQQKDDVLIFPKFMKAQEAKSSDKLRQQESRERRRAQALTDVTQRDEMSQHVTDGHSMSQMVTPSLAVLSLAVPSQDPPKSPEGDAALVNQDWQPKPGKPPLPQALAELFRRAPELAPKRRYAAKPGGLMLGTGLPSAIESKLAHAWSECSKAIPPWTWDSFLLIADYFLAGQLQRIQMPLEYIANSLPSVIEAADKWHKAGRPLPATGKPPATPEHPQRSHPTHEPYVPSATQLEARRLRKEREAQESAEQHRTEGANAAAQATE